MSKSLTQIDGWKEDEIEFLNSCPICSSLNSLMIETDLTDKYLFGTQGVWNYYLCNQCKAGFLNPRPVEKYISKAYQSYYTHSDKSVNEPTGHKVRSAVRNSYLNKHLGYHQTPSNSYGNLILSLTPVRKARTERTVRHLYFKGGGSLLDVGCGDGTFLKFMSDAGWEVQGIEVDSIAAQTAREKGITVFEGTLTDNTFPGGSFDAITFNHVLEHIYDVSEMLHLCYKLLRPQGVIWIATPNIDSLGRKIFHKAWRGYEPPRHLQLFNSNVLNTLLRDSGFDHIVFPKPHYKSEWMYNASLSLLDSFNNKKPSRSRTVFYRLISRIEDYLALILPQIGEEIVVYGKKVSRENERYLDET